MPDDVLPADLAHVTPGYRRALWIVALLNAGYGTIEVVGGFLADSQALKADSLDFLGDGVITFLAVAAIGWSSAARSRTALIQGLFLGALGLGIVANTLQRFLEVGTPEAELMGGFAIIALLVNLTAALVLVPHREGDTNVRAVWLFSRNDALGNVGVLVGAGLVALTGSRKPDLIVALVVAALFLQSAWSIVRGAVYDLTTVKVDGGSAS